MKIAPFVITIGMIFFFVACKTKEPSGQLSDKPHTNFRHSGDFPPHVRPPRHRPPRGRRPRGRRQLPKIEGVISQTVPVAFTKFMDNVEVYGQGDYIVVKTDNVPNHKSPYFGKNHPLYKTPRKGMQFNPHRIAKQDITFYFPKNPTLNNTITPTQLGAIGVALNGVVFFNQYAAGFSPLEREIRSFDIYNGHPSPRNDYHYHLEPKALTNDDSKLIA